MKSPRLNIHIDRAHHTSTSTHTQNPPAVNGTTPPPAAPPNPPPDTAPHPLHNATTAALAVDAPDLLVMLQQQPLEVGSSHGNDKGGLGGPGGPDGGSAAGRRARGVGGGVLEAWPVLDVGGEGGEEKIRLLQVC